MILNEDYFDKLEITDEEIDTMIDQSPDSDIMTVDDICKIKSNYSRLIMLSTDYIDISQDNTEIWDTILPKIIKQFNYLLYLFNIEHSDCIITAESVLDKVKYIHNYKNYNIFTEKENFNENSSDNRLKLWIYVNYPNFSYKQAFRFIYKLLNMFKFNKMTQQIVLFTDTSSYCNDNTMNFYIDYLYNNGMYLKKLFYSKGNWNSIQQNFTMELSCKINQDNFLVRRFYIEIIRFFFNEVMKGYVLMDKIIPFTGFRF